MIRLGFPRDRRMGSKLALAGVVLVFVCVGRVQGDAEVNDLRGTPSLIGSTVAKFSPSGLQKEVIYKKFPADEFVGPSDAWQISFGVLLTGAPANVAVTLRLAVPGQPPDIQITDDQATLTFEADNGLHQNYDVIERFEIVYNGVLDPYVGPIDFVLEPAGFPDVPVRVHLNVAEEPGFSPPSNILFAQTTPVGNIVGDGKLEILVEGQVGGVSGLFALDHTGNVLPGWPLINPDPAVVSQVYVMPNLADLDQDGFSEIVVMGTLTRNVFDRNMNRGTASFETLTVADGTGAILWQVEGGVEAFSIPAIGDLDGDGDLDIVVSTGTNFRRYESDGTLVAGWQVQAPGNIYIQIPVIADIDGDPSNGLEIAACATNIVPGQPEKVYVWKTDGSIHGAGWPKEFGANSCSPVTVVDLDSNPGNGLEVIMGADHFENPPVDPKTGLLNTFDVFVWHSDGSDVSGWPHHYYRPPGGGLMDDRVFTGASAGDLDADGDIEVVLGTYGQGDPANGNLFVFNNDGTLDPNWPRWAGIAQTPSAFGGTALGDLDGDGLVEIVTASFFGTYVFRANGEIFEGFPRMSRDDFGQPVIADLDNDGKLEIVEASLVEGLFAWQLSTPAAHTQPWPIFRQNSSITGALPLRTSVPILGWSGSTVVCCLMLIVGTVTAFRSRRFRGLGVHEPKRFMNMAKSARSMF